MFATKSLFRTAGAGEGALAQAIGMMDSLRTGSSGVRNTGQGGGGVGALADGCVACLQMLAAACRWVAGRRGSGVDRSPGSCSRRPAQQFPACD